MKSVCGEVDQNIFSFLSVLGRPIIPKNVHPNPSRNIAVTSIFLPSFVRFKQLFFVILEYKIIIVE